MLIFSKPHFCISLSLPFSLSLRACVRACACRLPTALTLLQLTEAHRDAAPTRFSSGSAPVPSVLRASTNLPRVVFAVQAPLHSISFPPFFGSSHAAVVELDTGQFVIDQAASRWIWRLLGTRTLSPRRYPPPKLSSRFPVGEYNSIVINRQKWHVYLCETCSVGCQRCCRFQRWTYNVLHYYTRNSWNRSKKHSISDMAFIIMQETKILVVTC